MSSSDPHKMIKRLQQIFNEVAHDHVGPGKEELERLYEIQVEINRTSEKMAEKGERNPMQLVTTLGPSLTEQFQLNQRLAELAKTEPAVQASLQRLQNETKAVSLEMAKGLFGEMLKRQGKAGGPDLGKLGGILDGLLGGTKNDSTPDTSGDAPAADDTPAKKPPRRKPPSTGGKGFDL